MSSRGPILLAIESATPSLSIALFSGRDLIAEREAPPGTHHAETLLPLLEVLLGFADLRATDIERFAISIGPGSFTSLRVGLATVKGLAFATGRRAVAVPTLAALAWGHARAHPDRDREEPIAAVLDAHRDEFYAAVFDVRDDGPHERGSTGLYTPEELGVRLPERCVVVGDGAKALAAAGRVLPPGIRCSRGGGPPQAASVGALAVLAFECGEGEDPADLVPRYVRRAQAEVTRTAQRTE